MDDLETTQESARAEHPKFKRTKPIRVRMELIGGTRCIGNIHVSWPDGRVSDVLNDERQFMPMTGVVLESDSTRYDFLTVAKSQIAMIFEIRR